MSEQAATYDPPSELHMTSRRMMGYEIIRRVGPVPHDHVDHIIVRRYVGDQADCGARALRVAAFIVRAMQAAEARGDRP